MGKKNCGHTHTHEHTRFPGLVGYIIIIWFDSCFLLLKIKDQKQANGPNKPGGFGDCGRVIRIKPERKKNQKKKKDEERESSPCGECVDYSVSYRASKKRKKFVCVHVPINVGRFFIYTHLSERKI